VVKATGRKLSSRASFITGYGRGCRVANSCIVRASVDSESSRNKKASIDGDSRACEYHMKTARERYKPSLEALGCICKALLARNLESCCSTRRRASPEQTKHGSKSNLSRSPSTQPKEEMSCCARKSSQGCYSSGVDSSVGVPKDLCDIQSKGYSGGSCRNSWKSSCSVQGYGAVL
jgi:hypothetical protein